MFITEPDENGAVISYHIKHNLDNLGGNCIKTWIDTITRGSIRFVICATNVTSQVDKTATINRKSYRANALSVYSLNV